MASHLDRARDWQKRRDDVIALVWLCKQSGISMTIDKGNIRLVGIFGSPQQELFGLLKSYKPDIIQYFDDIELPFEIRRDIDEAFETAGWDEWDEIF